VSFDPTRRFIMGHASFTPFNGGAGIDDVLLQDRVIMVGDLSFEGAQAVVGQLLFLERQDPREEISLYVNAGSGPIDAALALYDAMHLVSCAVSTVCIGTAAGGAALIVAGGAPGRRAALPHSRFILRQPSGEFAGSAADAAVAAAEAKRLRETVVEILARHCGRSAAEIEEQTAHDLHLSAQEALAWGLVDKVIERPPKAWRGIVR
jgi:ATP-dependent Clp protease protease subunit